MVPLLLLLLLPKSLADKVCFNISNNGIITTTNTTNASILDMPSHNVECKVREHPCVFQCIVINRTQFYDSYTCLEANVTKTDMILEYKIPKYGTCTIHLCNDTVIHLLINSLSSDSSDQSAMKQLFYIRDSCVELFSSHRKIMMEFLKVERRMIHSIMNTSQFKNGISTNYNLKFLSLNVFNISETHFSCAGNKSRIPMKAPQLLPQNESFVPEVWLPVNALCTIPNEKKIIGLVSYMWHSQFQFDQEEISSMVLRIELLEGHLLHNLKTPIKMIFGVDAHNDMDNDSWLQCHYFDEQEGLWKTDGCETSKRTIYNKTDIVCSCNHATPFAVLLVRQPIAEAQWKILSYISYTGCSLSAFFTALSIVMYIFSRKHKMDYSISVHVSLSMALFLLNSTFLLTELVATMKPDWVCMLVAALMHYSLLCCFTWMAIEGLHLYLLLIKVFNTYYKHYLAKLSLAGWGIPGVIVAVSLGLKDFKQFYGVTRMTMADTNQTNAICWITDDTFFYSLNLVYFTVVFIFNSGILVAVASSIIRMKKVSSSNSKLKAETKGKTWNDSDRFKESCRSGLTVLGLTCLMGTTWGLAFLGSGYISYPILYLFCIFNSTQGFFIFLWICQSVKKKRKRDLEDRMTSTPVKTSEIKSD